MMQPVKFSPNLSRKSYREVAHEINTCQTFKELEEVLGLGRNQVMHRYKQGNSLLELQRLADFILDLFHNGHFRTDGKNGDFTNDKREWMRRARGLFFAIAKGKKRLVANVASERFQARWKDTYTL